MNKLIFFNALLCGWVLGAELDTLTAKNEVTFLAVGQPSAIKIRGSLGKAENPISGKVSFKDGKATGKLTLKLEALDTGIETRNRHMKEKYLQVASYPNAELEFSCPLGKKSELTGKLTLHGKTNAVKGSCGASAETGLNVDFRIKVQDFGIEVPSYMGITVTDEVSVQAKTEGKAG